MDKLAIAGFTSAYTRHIGRKPWLEAGVLGTGGALAGYHGMKFLVPGLIRVLLAGKSPGERRNLFNKIKKDGTLRFLQNLGLGLGGLAGLGYVAQKHLDVGSGFPGMRDSMKSSKYWSSDKGKARLEEMSAQRIAEDIDKATLNSTGYSSGRGESKLFQKNNHDRHHRHPAPPSPLEMVSSGARGGGGDPLFSVDRIPMAASLDLIYADPFLSRGQKRVAGMVLEGAEGGNSGLVSGRDVARSAIQAGAGGGVGFLLGKTMGALLSLPSPVKSRLSAVGAIAGAIANTGLFSGKR